MKLFCKSVMTAMAFVVALMGLASSSNAGLIKVEFSGVLNEDPLYAGDAGHPVPVELSAFFAAGQQFHGSFLYDSSVSSVPLLPFFTFYPQAVRDTYLAIDWSAPGEFVVANPGLSSGRVYDDTQYNSDPIYQDFLVADLFVGSIPPVNGLTTVGAYWAVGDWTTAPSSLLPDDSLPTDIQSLWEQAHSRRLQVSFGGDISLFGELTDISISPVSEPSSLAIVGMALIGMGVARRRRSTVR